MSFAKSHEILKATEPAFGDVRAPRQWNDTANDYLVNEIGLINHAFENKGGYWIVDCALVLHVDDFLGAGEGIYSLNEVKADAAAACENFQNRVNLLAQNSDSAHGTSERRCGAEVQRSPDMEVISVSLREYVNKIKPLSMEKTRKNMQDDYCTDKEQIQAQ